MPNLKMKWYNDEMQMLVQPLRAFWTLQFLGDDASGIEWLADVLVLSPSICH